MGCFAQRFENHVAVNQPVEELNFKRFTIHNLHSLQPTWVAHMLEAKDARRSAPTITCEKHETSCGKTLSKALDAGKFNQSVGKWETNLTWKQTPGEFQGITYRFTSSVCCLEEYRSVWCAIDPSTAVAPSGLLPLLGWLRAALANRS